MHDFPWRHGFKNGKIKKIKKKKPHKYLNNLSLISYGEEKKHFFVLSSSLTSEINVNTGEALQSLMPVKCL